MLSVVVNTTAFSSRWEGSYSGVPSARLPWAAAREGGWGGWGVLSEVGGGVSGRESLNVRTQNILGMTT